MWVGSSLIYPLMSVKPSSFIVWGGGTVVVWVDERYSLRLLPGTDNADIMGLCCRFVRATDQCCWHCDAFGSNCKNLM